jgi:hypothetical protein
LFARSVAVAAEVRSRPEFQRTKSRAKKIPPARIKKRSRLEG